MQDEHRNNGALETALSQLESASANFAQRFLKDGRVRQSYIEQTRKLSQEYRARVASGALSPQEAATQVQSIRNEILEVQRLRSSDIGQAKAIQLKKVGLSLEALTEKYAKDKFGKPFARLATNEPILSIWKSLIVPVVPGPRSMRRQGAIPLWAAAWFSYPWGRRSITLPWRTTRPVRWQGRES